MSSNSPSHDSNANQRTRTNEHLAESAASIGPQRPVTGVLLDRTQEPLRSLPRPDAIAREYPSIKDELAALIKARPELSVD